MLECLNLINIMIFPITAAISILSIATASPTSRYVVHERREIGNSAWVPVEAKLNGRTIIPLSIDLTQRNLEKGHDFLMDISDPTSQNYGKNWTPEKARLSSISPLVIKPIGLGSVHQLR
jgi:tripeptidyl-peptidase-1